jgi:hypothetical protein
MSEQTKTLTLSDGKVAVIRRPKGRDLVAAMTLAGAENRYKYTCALLAQIATIDGAPRVMEDVLELYASDIDLMATAAGGDFLLSSAESSPS